MDDAAREIAAATKKDIGLLGLLREAYAGRLRVCAVVPTWRTPGSGELVFHTDDGGRMSCVSDGVFRHLSKHDFQALQTHNRLSLAGRRVELPNSESGGHIEAFIGPDAPTIGIDDLRVSAAEIERFIGSRLQAEAGGKALSLDQGDDQHGMSIASWQEQARKIADELHRRDLIAGAWSSNSDIADRVAAEAIRRGITGPRGQLTAGNILREALQGKRWIRPKDESGNPGNPGAL